jgi:hypothetical protein
LHLNAKPRTLSTFAASYSIAGSAGWGCECAVALGPPFSRWPSLRELRKPVYGAVGFFGWVKEIVSVRLGDLRMERNGVGIVSGARWQRGPLPGRRTLPFRGERLAKFVSVANLFADCVCG